MKKLIIKVVLFLSPIMFLEVFTFLFYSTDNGDLCRMGYIAYISDYSQIFKKEYEQKVYYTKISDVDLSKKNKFTVLTIGDSFSEQEAIGYQNYLSKNGSISVLHYEDYLNINPIQTLYGILNGDLLDSLNVNYIVLQSVERSFVDRAKGIDFNKKVYSDSLMKLINARRGPLKAINNSVKKKQNHIKKEGNMDKFFTDRIFKFPLYNLLYCFDDNAYDSPTYKVRTTKNLFSGNKNELLFYTDDLPQAKINNDVDSLFKLNNELNYLANKLKNKGIKLIVLPCPDKFDMYYDYIVNKEKYVKPLFFQNLMKMPKNYLFLNAKQILGAEINRKNDIYYYDDTHWSPYGALLIADELARLISQKQ